MDTELVEKVRQLVDSLYRNESRRVFATLIRLIGDFDLAEESLHEAFSAAMEQWSREGIPANPRAWLVSTGRFKAIDTMRRRARFDAGVATLARRLDQESPSVDDEDEAKFRDDQLRLVFTCCHPALSPEAQVALTLREVCGLTTEEIAAAFLTSLPTIAQRIVRGKAKIREAGIPFQVPSLPDLPGRLESVLSVIYLVFNEGYFASSGETLTRPDLTAEAIRLGRLLLELLPDSEVMGLLALMLLHESRRLARTTPDGDLILLEDQDRRLWQRGQIAEGVGLVTQAFAAQRIGVYTLQAAIAAAHAEATSAATTDWGRIVAIYDVLARVERSPIVELNRAVAFAMRDGPLAGLPLIDVLIEKGGLGDYHLAHAARADLYRRLGQAAEARESYQRALELVRQDPERRFLERRLRELS